MQLFVYKNGKKLGPYRETVVRKLMADAMLGADDLAWHEGLQNWTALGQIFAAGAAPASGQRTAAMYAGFWRRLAAYLVDLVIVMLLLMVVGLAIGTATYIGTDTPMAADTGIYNLIALVGVWLYFALFESSAYQATPGKMLIKLRVTDVQGRRISFLRATGRYFAKILSGLILLVGYMMAGWTERKQALHDMLADTLVVRTQNA